MNVANTAELRPQYVRAEEQHQSAFRRAQWLERRMLDAPTEAEFLRLEKELKEQEDTVRALAFEATRRRIDYLASLA